MAGSKPAMTEESTSTAAGILWQGRSDEADQEMVLLLSHGSKIAERNGVSVQESTTDLTRLCTELKGILLFTGIQPVSQR